MYFTTSHDPFQLKFCVESSNSSLLTSIVSRCRCIAVYSCTLYNTHPLHLYTPPNTQEREIFIRKTGQIFNLEFFGLPAPLFAIICVPCEGECVCCRSARSQSFQRILYNFIFIFRPFFCAMRCADSGVWVLCVCAPPSNVCERKNVEHR